jgi:hypothetical protein
MTLSNTIGYIGHVVRPQSQHFTRTNPETGYLFYL